MKKYLLYIALVVCGCNNTPNKESDTPEDVLFENGNVSTVPAADTMCYMLTQGKENQDTQVAKIVITGNVVEGKLMYMPAEKDWRFGNIKGEKNADILNLQWTFVQEGIKDSTTVIMKMTGNQLFQKSTSYNPETGKEFIADTSQFSVSYQKVDCGNLPKHDFDLGI